LNADPLQYAAAEIPTVFMSTPVQQIRWQDFLDNFSFNTVMPDLLNIKYVVFSTDQYLQEQSKLSPKYEKVFQSPDGAEVVIRNNAVLPKAWLVPSAVVVADRQQQLSILTDPAFEPRKVAFVESPPALALAQPDASAPEITGSVSIKKNENEQILLAATAPRNALLVLGEKYYKGWTAHVDGKKTDIVPVDRFLRGVYLPAGEHTVEFTFDPLPFKIGKYLTLASFALFAAMLVREWQLRRRAVRDAV